MQRASSPKEHLYPIIRIEPSTGWVALQLRELWIYRELLFFLVWRDVKVRYKQTVLGIAWAIIQPLFTMVVFTIIFGGLARLDSDGTPYALFSFTALVPWTFFANALSQGSNSLVGSAHLIKKVYFPRLAVPIATLLSAFVDFGLAFMLLIAMLLWFKIGFTLYLLLLPLFVLLACVTALGMSLWLSALNVQFRDIRYVIPFVISLWQFASPVIYSSSIIPGFWRPLYNLNPMVGVIDGFRWVLLGTPAPPLLATMLSAIMATLVLISGALYFRRTEKYFADVV